MPAKKVSTSAAKTIKTSFTCKFCEKSKPLAEMTAITRFFPAVIACKECARKWR